MDGLQIKQGDKRPEYRVILQGLITGIFGTVAVLTKHEHWCKEPAEVEPIVGPLCRMIEEMPKPALKALEKRMNGFALAAGAAVVIVPDAAFEFKIREAERAHRSQETRSNQSGSAQTGTRRHNPQGPVGYGNGANAQGDGQGTSNGAAPWADTLPDDNVTVDFRLPGA